MATTNINYFRYLIARSPNPIVMIVINFIDYSWAIKFSLLLQFSYIVNKT